MGCFGSDKQYTDSPQWFDPLGPSVYKNPQTGQVVTHPENGLPVTYHGNTGGPEMRDQIFSELNALAPGMNRAGSQAVTGLQTAASDPGWSAGANEARKTIAGGYLGGAPQFNQALADYQSQVGKTTQAVRQGAAASAADTASDLASRYARAGLGFSTANQQAQQASKAAGTARGNELAAGIENAANQFVAGSRLQNYSQERQAQQRGTQQLQDATSAPLTYLQAIPQTTTAPLAQRAQILSGLAGGGQIATPNSTIVRQPGAYDYMLSTVGAVSNW